MASCCFWNSRYWNPFKECLYPNKRKLKIVNHLKEDLGKY